MPKVSSKLDLPEVRRVLFHPRKAGNTPLPAGAIDWQIPVGGEARLGARFHLTAAAAPHILFFHGNGEIVCDYDEIAPMYNAAGLNLMAVDYRGYGSSTGSPSAATMLADAHVCLDAVKAWLAVAGRTGPLLVMGRSLGCACALELATNRGSELAGLIIESGFSETVPLLLALGVDVVGLGITEDDCFRNVSKAERITLPALFLHAQNDQLIPLHSAATLHAQCAAQSKELQIVPRADHNDIITRAGGMYFQTIGRFAAKAGGGGQPRRRSRQRG